MSYFKLNADGSYKTANKQHDGFESFDLLAKQTNGSLYDFYLLIPDTNGIYQPDTTSIQNSLNTARISEIDIRLDKIDILSIRSLRSKSNGRGNTQDDTQLTALDDEAILLRAERVTLAGT